MSVGAEDLPDLDPDDPRTPSEQIAMALRAAILMGRFAAGDRLPSQLELARRYGVARETVKSALRILDRNHLVVSRQGSGAFVRFRRESAVGLQDFLRSAFDRPHVSIDYAGFNGEALSNTLTSILRDVRDGRLTPTSLHVRVMVVDPSAPRTLPRPRDDRVSSRAVRNAVRQITHRAITRLTDGVNDLASLGLVNSARIDVRVHDLGPTFKLYLVNDEQALFGFYPTTDHSLTVAGQSVPFTYPSGWDATLFGHDSDTGLTTSGPSFTTQARAWFDSVWSTVATDYRP